MPDTGDQGPDLAGRLSGTRTAEPVDADHVGVEVNEVHIGGIPDKTPAGSNTLTPHGGPPVLEWPWGPITASRSGGTV
jgi:hypothetical protein